MRAIVSVFQDEDGWWITDVLNMRGCATQGKTREEALSRVREATGGWLEVMREDWPEVVTDLDSADIEEMEIAA